LNKTVVALGRDRKIEPERRRALFGRPRGFPPTMMIHRTLDCERFTLLKATATVLRIVQYAPGVTPRHHRTDSVDYGVILSGSIEMELDTETVKLNTGDLLVQRGTVHNWMNNSTEPCLIAYILIGANSVMINGIALPATG
jgi:quercetin dioxygenase-like cupin family protein